MERLLWSGGKAPYLHAPVVETVGNVSIGRFAGYGSLKNEDGLLVWSDPSWTFAVILDGHGGSSSVDAVLEVFDEAEETLVPLCAAADGAALPVLQGQLIRLLTSKRTARRMSGVQGETACLVCYQWKQHLLWLSIGDNTLYLLHPELGRLGQFALTTRGFFEWIGERNSLAGTPPYFSTGIRQLRTGRNSIVLVTDGIQELPGRPYEAPADFAAAFSSSPNEVSALQLMLAKAQQSQGRDSCTMLAWNANNPEPALMPSA
jgi:hypothetical protein